MLLAARSADPSVEVGLSRVGGNVGRAGERGVVAVFFFSSRRRHTRLQGDWSSDVCSSDLRNRLYISAVGSGGPVRRRRRSFKSFLLGLVHFKNPEQMREFKNSSRGLGETVEIGRASCRERV